MHSTSGINKGFNLITVAVVEIVIMVNAVTDVAIVEMVMVNGSNSNIFSNSRISDD